MKIIIFILSAFLLSACSSVPDNLKGADMMPLIEFSDVIKQPNINNGLSARWGGEIAAIENRVSDTVIEVVNFKLNSSARPQPSNETLGRFRIHYQGFLDPAIYKKGKLVTGLGVITAPEQGNIGEHLYVFPVLKAKTVHIWKEIKEFQTRTYHHNYDPFWPRYSPRPRVVVIKKVPSKK